MVSKDLAKTRLDLRAAIEQTPIESGSIVRQVSHLSIHTTVRSHGFMIQ
jgi:hypothetical protein